MIEATISLAKLEYFLLILVRITSFVYVAPFFGQTSVPQRVKIGFSFFVSVILLNILPSQDIVYNSVIGFATLVVKESIAGLLLAFSAFMCSQVIHFSGRLIDMEIGLAMAQEFDPATKTQTSVTGMMYSYFIMLIMIASDMHIFLLNALVESFSLIPIGGIKMGDSLYGTVIDFINNYFIIGFRIALPIFSAMLILNCVLGIMAKVAPQMHMFSIGIQLKIMGGFLILFVTVKLLPSISNFIFENMRTVVTEVMKGMV